MNPRPRHLRRPWAGRRLPGAGRSIRWLTAAAVIALAAPAEAQQPAGGATYGPVQRAETLSQLAVRFRGEANVNPQQVMIAILRANPGAFGDGNINALRSGVTLRVPTAAEMEAITPGEAAAEFARHDEAWRNRSRTGSAVPAPGPAPAPRVPPRPASPPAEEAAAGEGEGGGEVSEELRKARETVADLRKRLAERDEAIEDLLIQLSSVQRELRRLQAEAEPAPSVESAAPGGAASGGEAALPAAGWLPVSPLVLGSSLIVLLVLVVVVTLLRQRGETEEPFEEEGEGEEAGEDPEDGTRDEEEPPAPEGEAEPGDEGSARDSPPEGGSGKERRGPASSRTGAGDTAAAVASAAGEGEAEEGWEEIREGEAEDLPIGIDLDTEEPWEGSVDGPIPGGPDGLADGEVDPAAGPPREASIDLGEGDDPPDDAPAPGRGKRGRRE